MRRRLSYFFPAAVIVAVVLALAPATQSQSLVPLSNVNTFPNNGQQSETAIAISPTNRNNIIAAANNISGAAVPGAEAVFFSNDGGLTWAQPATPLSLTTNGNNSFTNASDPRLDFDGNGNAFCSYILFSFSGGKPATTALVVSKSTDGGNNWGAPVAIVDHTGEKVSTISFEDREAMAIDRTSNTIYVAWTHFNKRIPVVALAPGDEIFFAKSTNGGASWTRAISASGLFPEGVQASTIAVAINGDVYIAWEDLIQTNILVTRFIHGRGIPLPPMIVGGYTMALPATPPPGLVGLSIPAQPARGITPAPAIACDSHSKETIYVAWPSMGSNGSTDVDILFSKSSHSGLHWSSPRRVNNDSGSSNASQFNCAMAVDPDDNSINISYYDTRNDPANRKADYFISRSQDGGGSFSDTQASTAPSDESTSNPSSDVNDYGDYSGVAARGGFVFPCWTDSRISTEQVPVPPATFTPTENVYVARVGACSSGVEFKVTTTKDNQKGSLRQALAQAGACGRITFNVKATDSNFNGNFFTFSPVSALPPIAGSNVTLDGKTEDAFLGSSPNSGGPLITIRAPSTMPAGSNGLTINAGASNTAIQSLAIGNFASGTGIASSGLRTTISNCWIGLSGAGVSLANQDGIQLLAGANSSIIRSNVVSSNLVSGIQIDSDNNQIGLNNVGTTIKADGPLGNGASGILITVNSKGNIIGKHLDSGGVNVISGNGGDGILINGSENIVGSNRIGTDRDGSHVVRNSGDGIEIRGGKLNSIGTLKQGGGGANIISGNGGSGVVLTLKAKSNIVTGNFVGVDVFGRHALPNEGDGVEITGDSESNLIGDVGPRLANVISLNSQNGVLLAGNQTMRNQVSHNFIGTQSDGVTSLPNQSNGVLITQGAKENVIGGNSEAEGNVIIFNAGNGVRVEAGGVNPKRNLISHNSIFNNNKIGIDLVGGMEDSHTGVTANDDRDVDDGPNQLQNAPALVRFDTNGRTVNGTLNSTPNTRFLIEVFANQKVIAGSRAQGELFDNRITNVTTDANGNASFVFTIQLNHFTLPLTATATDPNGNTSEFSNMLESSIARSSRDQLGGNIVTRAVDGILRGLGLRRKPLPARPKP